MTITDYFRLDELEDMIVALENGYYDSYDLDAIDRDRDIIEEEIESLRRANYIIDELNLPHYSIIDNKCVQRVVYAYTDGSAVVNGKNKGKGGFGTYFPNLFGRKKAWSLGFENGKTGEMEVSALYYAITAMPIRMKYTMILRVYSDSEYVVKSFTEKRLEKWISNNWTNTSGEVKNKELWQMLLTELNQRSYLKLEMKHIRSHQVEKEKDPIKKTELMENPHIIGNMMADRLADYKRHKKLYKSNLLLC